MDLSQDLSALDLSSPTEKKLRKLGIANLQHLMNVNPLEWLSVGDQASHDWVREIRRALQHAGVSWKPYDQLISPPPKYRVPKQSLSYRPAKYDLVLNRAGGAPSSWGPGSRWPKCNVCRKPMRFIFQLLGKAGGGKIDFGENQAIQLFLCSNVTGAKSCPVDRAFSGANMPVFRDRIFSKALSLDLQPFPVFEVHVEEGIDDRRIDSDYLGAFRAMNATIAHEAMLNSEGDKFGGVILSKPLELECASCFEPMKIFARLSDPALPSPFSTGDFFLHQCSKCSLLAFQWRAK